MEEKDSEEVCCDMQSEGGKWGGAVGYSEFARGLEGPSLDEFLSRGEFWRMTVWGVECAVYDDM